VKVGRGRRRKHLLDDLRETRTLEIERNTKWQSVERLWKRLWTCRKTYHEIQERRNKGKGVKMFLSSIISIEVTVPSIEIIELRIIFMP
jgi:hypothetical protein